MTDAEQQQEATLAQLARRRRDMLHQAEENRQRQQLVQGPSHQQAAAAAPPATAQPPPAAGATAVIDLTSDGEEEGTRPAALEQQPHPAAAAVGGGEGQAAAGTAARLLGWVQAHAAALPTAQQAAAGVADMVRALQQQAAAGGGLNPLLAAAAGGSPPRVLQPLPPGAAMPPTITTGGPGALGGAAGAPAEPPRPFYTRRVPASFQAGRADDAPRPHAAPSADAQAALRSVLDGLQTAGDDEELEPREGSLTVPLMRHQRVALAWMARRESAASVPVGGILADDQGLGKTVTTIALIALSNPSPLRSGGGGGGGGGGGWRPQPKLENGAPAAAADKPSFDEVDLLTSSSSSSESSSSEDSSSDDSDVLEVVGDDADDDSGGAAPAGAAPPPAAPGAAPRPPPAAPRPGAGAPQGGTLIVCPTTLLAQWADEVRAKAAPRAGLSVHVYHGRGKDIAPAVLARFAVVLTTYGTLAADAPAAARPAKKADKAAARAAAAAAAAGGEPAAKRARADGGGAPADRGGPLFAVRWHRAVLDEAQCIKNARTLTAHAAWALRAGRRWCLSGTPLQNAVDDLYPYVRFLKYTPWSAPGTFKSLVRDPCAAGQTVGFRRLQAMLQPVVLRRTKASRVGGQPVVQLPARRVATVRRDFSPAEAEFYKRLNEEASRTVRRLQAQGQLGSHYVNVLWMLLRLRQACDHPALVRGGARGPRPPAPPGEVAAARRLAPAARAALRAALAEEGGGSAACAVCGDAPDDAAAAVCGHVFCQQCAAARVGAAGHGAAEAALAFHCPAPGCGRPLGRHDVFSAEALAEADGEAPGGGGGAAPAPAAPAAPAGQGSWLTGGGGPGFGAAAARARAGGAAWTSSTKIDALMELLRELRAAGPGARGGGGGGGAAAAGAAPAAAPRPPPAAVGRNLSEDRLASAISARKWGGGAPGALGGAAFKFSAAAFYGGGAAGGGPAAGLGAPAAPSAAAAMEKVIVFSQWTSMLDLVETPLRREGFRFRRLDGSMAVPARQAAIRDFSHRPDVEVLLVSLKAASLGLNLVSASRVVLLDPWYNPTVEDQAIDRAHRIGQTRDVHVTRLTIAGSVEDRILALQERKREMVASAFGEGGDGAGARLTADDLRYLFS